jgi:branched-chain amino acid transport system ATP-binding protein
MNVAVATGRDKPATTAQPDVMLEVRQCVAVVRRREGDQDVSFNIHKGEIRAIIGPNGAGKTSMLNVINGFYHPQEGTITFKGETRSAMRPYVAASQGIARTFQNVALFKGMSTLDNIMSGRTLKMKKNFFWQMLRFGPARTEEIEHRDRVEEIIDFLEIQHIRRHRSAGCPMVCKSAWNLAGRWRWSRSCCCSMSRWPA